jgi:hypothetical protein
MRGLAKTVPDQLLDRSWGVKNLIVIHGFPWKSTTYAGKAMLGRSGV